MKETMMKEVMEETPEERDFVTKLFKRENRNQLLKESDKYLLPDYPITADKLDLIKDYRQQLRDYTKLDGFINYTSTSNITMPDFPPFPF